MPIAKDVLLETHMNNFVPEGFLVHKRLSATLFLGEASAASQGVAMQDPRVKSLSFAQELRVKKLPRPTAGGLNKSQVKAAKLRQED